MNLNKSAKKVVHPKDFPTQPHWQIWLQDSYTPVTGYEHEAGGGGSKTHRWNIYAYLDEQAWKEDVLGLTRAAIDPERDR